MGCGSDASKADPIDTAKSAHECEGVRAHVVASNCDSELLRRVDKSAPSLELKSRELLLDVHGSATMGTLQTIFVESSLDGARTSGMKASSWRPTAMSLVRQALARTPNCRMRTKPRGSTCWTKR